MPSVGTPTVTPAPEYTPSPEEAAWMESYQGQLEDWVASGGYGIPEEVQGQMIQRQTDILKAKETEDIRVMRNDMERRGLTNSGFVFSNEMKIRAATTQAIANSMTDIAVQSALMKLASFEKAIGAMGEFLGYLSAQSQLAYAPILATWNAQQQANLAAYQAQVQAALTQYQAQAEMIRTQMVIAAEERNQAANRANQERLLQMQLDFDRWRVTTEVNSAAEAARSNGIGSVLGTISGIGLALLL